MDSADRRLVDAVDFAATGDWQRAHEIVQEMDGDRIASWIHALVHRLEGDLDNARYWYRRAGQSYEAYSDPKAELAAIKAVLGY